MRRAIPGSAPRDNKSLGSFPSIPRELPSVQWTPGSNFRSVPMPKPGPRTTYRYSAEFKATAVHLSQLPGVSVSEVAESLYIHPFMLSRWRRLAREGQIMTKRGGDVTAAARPEIGRAHV